MVKKSNQRPRPLLGGETSFRPRGTIGQQVVLRKPDSLAMNPHNSRTHSKRQIRQIANSIKTAGFIGAIVIDEADIVLRGHGTLAACKNLKLERVPTLRVTGLSEAEKRAFLIADNKIAENAGWDQQTLAAELRELAELLPPLNLGLELTGFSPAEVDALFADRPKSKGSPVETLPPLELSAVTRRGDLWCLGHHRLLCGDARSAADLDRLMNNERAAMAFLDPPPSQVRECKSAKHERVALASDEMSEQEYGAPLREGLANAARVSVDGAVHFICGDWRGIAEIITAGRAVYGPMLNLCVWVKSNIGLDSPSGSEHELIAVFQVGAARHNGNAELGSSMRKRSNVWTYSGVNSLSSGCMEADIAPTTKPVALIADAIRDCTNKGDVVLDPFLGPGSTMIAAEKIGRRCYGLEGKPCFVDVAIRRWEAYTKSQVVLDSDGRTYAQVKVARMAELRQPATASADDKPNSSHSVVLPNEGEDWVRLCEPVRVIPSEGSDQ